MWAGGFLVGFGLRGIVEDDKYDSFCDISFRLDEIEFNQERILGKVGIKNRINPVGEIINDHDNK